MPRSILILAAASLLAQSIQPRLETVPFGAPQAPAILWEAPKPPPVTGISDFATSHSSTTRGGVTWLATSSSILRIDTSAPPADRFRYLSSRRYLPEGDVVRIVPDSGTGLWVRTTKGVGHLTFPVLTLEAKAAAFEERVESRHNRHGMVADSQLRIPGDLSTNQTVSSDNDGLWTAMYGAAQCFRYAATRSPEALARARRSVEALLFLEQITGKAGLPARSYVRKGEPRPADGVWHGTPDGSIQWKGDTSSDEIVGHFYLFGIAWDLLDDPEMKGRISAAARRMMEHILANGYHLVDVTGQPTYWGRWSPAYFASKRGRPDSPLNAVELLSFLKTAHHVTGDAKYDREYRKAAFEMKYADLATRQRELAAETNYSDEELAMLSFYPLFEYERDAGLRAVYAKAEAGWWHNIQREQNPLWIYIHARIDESEARQHFGAARRTLERIPMDLVTWTVTNSGRPDVRADESADRFSRQQSRTLLPPDERPVMKWNGNPFVVDGGNGGRSEDDGAFFLLPYWMGRYFRYVCEGC